MEYYFALYQPAQFLRVVARIAAHFGTKCWGAHFEKYADFLEGETAMESECFT